MKLFLTLTLFIPFISNCFAQKNIKIYYENNVENSVFYADNREICEVSIEVVKKKMVYYGYKKR